MMRAAYAAMRAIDKWFQTCRFTMLFAHYLRHRVRRERLACHAVGYIYSPLPNIAMRMAAACCRLLKYSYYLLMASLIRYSHTVSTQKVRA